MFDQKGRARGACSSFFDEKGLIRMLNVLLKLNAHKTKMGANLDIFLLICSFIAVIFILFTMLIAIFIRDYLVTVLIVVSLSQYNVPLFVKSVIDNTFFHYYHSKETLRRYVAFELVKNNPLLFFMVVFLLIEFVFSIMYLDVIMVLVLIVSFVLSINMIVNHFVLNPLIKIINYVLYGLVISATMWPSISRMCIALIMTLGLLYTNIENIEVKNQENEHTINHTKFDNTNNVHLFNFLFLKRTNLKTLYITMMVVLVYMWIGHKNNFTLDYTVLIVILYLVEVELMSDLNFKKLSKTTARYYYIHFANASFLKKFMLSCYFSYFILYSTMLFIASAIGSVFFVNSFQMFNFLFICPLLWVIGIFYFYLEKIMVLKKKKQNNFLCQYFVFIVITVYFIIVKWTFKF